MKESSAVTWMATNELRREKKAKSDWTRRERDWRKLTIHNNLLSLQTPNPRISQSQSSNFFRQARESTVTNVANISLEPFLWLRRVDDFHLCDSVNEVEVYIVVADDPVPFCFFVKFLPLTAILWEFICSEVNLVFRALSGRERHSRQELDDMATLLSYF